MTRHSASRGILYTAPPGSETGERADDEVTAAAEEAGDGTTPSTADD